MERVVGIGFVKEGNTKQLHAIQFVPFAAVPRSYGAWKGSRAKCWVSRAALGWSRTFLRPYCACSAARSVSALLCSSA